MAVTESGTVGDGGKEMGRGNQQKQGGGNQLEDDSAMRIKTKIIRILVNTQRITCIAHGGKVTQEHGSSCSILPENVVSYWKTLQCYCYQYDK